MASNKKNSRYIIPLAFLFDILLLNGLLFRILPENYHILFFVLYINFIWVIISLNINYYEIYRFTKLYNIIIKNIKQFAIFLILCYAFSGFYFNNVKSFRILNYVLYSFFFVLSFEIIRFYALHFYRKKIGGNYINTVFFGNGLNTKKLIDLLSNNPHYGYKVNQIFTSNEKSIAEEELEHVFDYCIQNNITHLYISLHNLPKDLFKKAITFSDNNLKTVKFIPENKDLFSYDLKLEYYQYIPVFTKLKSSLQDPITATFKRIFDIAFSLFVILFLLSWLIPIMAVLIKLESKGPVFFKQSRPGFDEKEFMCFKFRSMRINDSTEKEATRNDPRVTKIGKFIRKTSIDELPQFFNVLFGDMSIVGPRPHLWTQNKVYGKKIDRYMMRHYVKPGITGLAQVRGYRGEIETDNDMINRINYDVYYIENWSFLLDIKIIIQTVVNIFKGEEKAY